MPKNYIFNIKRLILFTAIIDVVLSILIIYSFYQLNELITFSGYKPSQFRFEHHQVLWLLLLIPLHSIISLYFVWWRNKSLKRFADISLLKNITSPISLNKNILKFTLIHISLIFFIVSLANPQYGVKEKKAKMKGIDIIIALDVSKSMNAVDKNQSKSRLELAKTSINRLIQKLKGDRIGLIVFSGEAIVQLPLTTDYTAANMFLQTINTDIVPTPGTSISSAILTAIEAYNFSEETNKSLIIITDGEDHEKGIEEAKKIANDNNIIINTIGIGSELGVPIPLIVNGKKNGYLKDNEGTTVISKLNEKMLKEIALACNGNYIHAEGSNLGLSYLVNELNKIEKSEFETIEYEDYEDRFQYFLFLGLSLLIIELFIGNRNSFLTKKLNLHHESHA